MFLLQILQMVTIFHIGLCKKQFSYVVWPYVPFVSVSDDLWEEAKLGNGYLNQTNQQYDTESIRGVSVQMLGQLLNKCVGPKAYTLELKGVLSGAKSALDSPPKAHFYLPMAMSMTRVQSFRQILKDNETFIPLIESPGVWLITKASSDRSFSDDMIAGWPLILFICTLCLVSGSVIWLLERDSPKSDFDKPVPTGIGNGTWWSIVTMTTVGESVFILTI